MAGTPGCRRADCPRPNLWSPLGLALQGLLRPLLASVTEAWAEEGGVEYPTLMEGGLLVSSCPQCHCLSLWLEWRPR